MLHALKLLVPALVPSWRFFDVIAPSPRIEYASLQTKEDAAQDWQEFRPRPLRLSPADALKGLFWNPGGNESLFLVSCAERLIKNPTDHSYQHILQRLKTALPPSTPFLQFRLVLVHRNGDGIERHVVFTSPAEPWS